MTKKSELRIFVIYTSSLMYTVVCSLYNSHKLEAWKNPQFYNYCFQIINN